MRWHEIISEKLVHASRLADRPMGTKIKKAVPLVPGVVPPTLGQEIAMALPQIAQAVAGGSQMAAQTAVALDDQEEQTQASMAAQEYEQAKQPQ